MTRREEAESWNAVLELCAGLKATVSAIANGVPPGVVIFGAGSQGRVASRYLMEHGVKIGCFTDNDPRKQGTRLDGVPVVPPSDLSVLSAPMVVIATRQAVLSVRQQLRERNISSLSFDAFFAVLHIDRLAHVRNRLLNDDRSRLIYDAILKTMLTGDSSYCASVMEGNQYFALPDFVSSNNEHFVDAGAYVGDTVERFIWTSNGVFSKIYAFEPGLPQQTAMRHRLDRLCREWAISPSAIVCENAGLAESNKSVDVNVATVLANTSLGSSGLASDKQVGSVACYSLDGYLAGQCVTFLKADIEGMELAMLHGARDTIQAFRPKLALSIYHTPAHLFEIAEYVHELVPEYRMAVRHHSRVFAETVLYCWIP